MHLLKDAKTFQLKPHKLPYPNLLLKDKVNIKTTPQLYQSYANCIKEKARKQKHFGMRILLRTSSYTYISVHK